MSKPIIEVINISKKFSIGQKSSDIRHSISNFFSFKQDKKQEIWALKDVSFEVQEGEVFGLIGPNGSGKSTLLKILSKITYPTSGKAILRGRISSLLEVGTGFHNELTGRENIFLNGSILGMKRAEIKEKFDEIVGFSGIEQFIDTPVKHYSSGMYVRLAFSVAAHLEPEILLVDEVLSVGDLEFRQKSMGKMNEVAKQGRTVIFVSHNLEAIESLCTKGIYLNSGVQKMFGNTFEVVNVYKIESRISDKLIKIEKFNQYIKTIKIEFYDSFGQNSSLISSGDNVNIEIEVESNIYLKGFVVKIIFKDIAGNLLTECNNYLTGNNFELFKGNNKVICMIKKIPLNKGKYFIDIIISHRGKQIYDVKNIKQIEITTGKFYLKNDLPDQIFSFLIDYKWSRNE
jgi:lipopolysaccharide transport system ATP-binding protein